MRTEWRYLRNLDFVLLLGTLALAGFGLVMIASATGADWTVLFQPGAWTNPKAYGFFQRQIIWTGAGLGLLLASLLFDYRSLVRWMPYIYGLSLILLIIVMVIGRQSEEPGAQRWIPIGPFALQPSELAKLGIIVVLATVFSRRDEGAQEWRDLIVPALLLLPTLGLIILQPDLGTAIVVAGIFFGVLLVAGFPLARYGLLLGGSLAGAIGIIAVRFYLGKPKWIKPYQLTRLTIFLDPYADRFGFGYQIIQSQFALGSGRILGKGLYASDHSQLNYLPEHHTDFIFAILGEELGFIGAIGLLLLFTLVLWRGAKVAAEAKDVFGILLAAGIVTFLGLHVLINVGMVLGVMPVTGIPLPFISYGGSATLVNFTAIGLLLNVHMRRHKIQFG